MCEVASTPILALVRDLMFVGRITAEARAAGVVLRVVRDPVRLGIDPARLLIVDLNLDGAIPAAATWRDATGGSVVAFVAHTDSTTIATARIAGLDRVLARSAFVEALPRLLTQLA